MTQPLITFGNDTLLHWQTHVAQKNWRGVVFCVGDWLSAHVENTTEQHSDCKRLITQLSALQQVENAIVYSDCLAANAFNESLLVHLPFTTSLLSSQQSKSLLGQECDLLILNLQHEFLFEAVGQLTGMLKAGGLCLFLIPNESKGYTQRLASVDWWNKQLMHWQQEEAAEWLMCDFSQENCTFQYSIPKQKSTQTQRFNLEDASEQLRSACVSEEQANAVLAIKKVALGHRRRPCVIEADRGRGKSASLGIAAADLMAKHDKQTIWVCAQNKRATAQVFHYCEVYLQSLELSKRGLSVEIVLQGNLPVSLSLQSKTGDEIAELRFLAPDALIAALEESIPDLLMVDEAASLPLPLLSQAVQLANRVAFATTVHGYEGTGRSFELRFKPRLQQLSLGFNSVKITEPARWAKNDPLEAAIAELLLLSADELHSAESPDVFALQSVRLRNSELIAESDLLQQSFALLVLAHYKTSPNDLQQLLDNPNVLLFVTYAQCEQERRVVGCCLVMLEGELDASLAEPIQLGQRRVKGHILPQTMATYCLQPQTVEWRFARVVRIAVQPSLQHQGIGSWIMQRVCEAEVLKEIDFVGSSFGATSELVAFWRKQGFLPCRLGSRRDSTSGEFSSVVLKGVSQRANALLSQTNQHFAMRMLLQLSTRYRYLEPSLVLTLLQPLSGRLLSTPIEPISTQQLVNLVIHGADIEALWSELHSLALQQLNKPNNFCAVFCETLIVKILQGRDWPEYARHFELTGKKEAQAHFREAFSVWSISCG